MDSMVLYFGAVGSVSLMSVVQVIVTPRRVSNGHRCPPPRPPWPWPRGANETGSSSRIHPFHQKERTVTASLHQPIGAILVSAKGKRHGHHPHHQRRSHQSRRDRRGQVCFRAQYRLLPRHRSDGLIQGLTVPGGSVRNVIDRGVIYGRRVYTATFTPNANLDRTECSLIYDVAGTGNDATSAIFIVDTRA